MTSFPDARPCSSSQMYVDEVPITNESVRKLPAIPKKNVASNNQPIVQSQIKVVQNKKALVDQNLYRPIMSVDMDARPDYSKPRIIPVMAKEEAALRRLSTEDRMRLLTFYDTSKDGSHWLVRNLKKFPLINKVPPLDYAADFMSQEVRDHLRQTHPSIHMTEKNPSNIKKARLPSITADMKTWSRTKIDALGYIDPTVRPMVEFFDKEIGYVVDNRPEVPVPAPGQVQQVTHIQITTGAWVTLLTRPRPDYKLFAPSPPSYEMPKYNVVEAFQNLPTAVLVEIITWLLKFGPVFTTNPDNSIYDVAECTTEERINSNVILLHSWWHNSKSVTAPCPVRYRTHYGMLDMAMNHWKLALHSLLYFSTKQFRMAILNEAAQMSSWHLADLLPIWNTPVTPLGLVGLWTDWRVTMVPQNNIVDNRHIHRSIATTSVQAMVNFYNKENGPTKNLAENLPNPPKAIKTRRHEVELVERLWHANKKQDIDAMVTNKKSLNDVMKPKLFKYKLPATQAEMIRRKARQDKIQDAMRVCQLNEYRQERLKKERNQQQQQQQQTATTTTAATTTARQQQQQQQPQQQQQRPPQQQHQQQQQQQPQQQPSTTATTETTIVTTSHGS